MKDVILNTLNCKSIIHCGQGTFEKYSANIVGQKFIITDSNVYAFYGNLIEKFFGGSKVFVLKAGEKSKTLSKLVSILNAMADADLKRDCTVIAFGGGVVGDIAGLAASLYMRGVKLVQIPTTLLSQVDSSVGGKTAVDFKNIKNLLGTFYQPQEVIADPVFLKTLTLREIRCGLGEIIKYGALNKEIFKIITENKDNLFNPDFLANIVYCCICHKAKVVEADEHDLNGIRKTLNLGHTTGHALELFYRRKSHGEFVLTGMYCELYIADKLGVGNETYFNKLRELILKVIKVPAYEDIEKAAVFAKMDKKNSGRTISLIVPVEEGKTTELKLELEDYIKLLKESVGK